MVTKYVAGDGTGDYDADGTADNVPINQALSYANTYGTPASPVTIYLRGPYTYDLASWLLFGSNTILTGDTTAKLRLTDGAGWANIYTETDPGTEPLIKQLVSPIENVEIYGFEIDGNDTNQTGYIGGKLNYIIAYFLYCTNIRVHDMYLHDNLSDALRLDHCDGMYFYNNVVERTGHEGCYYIRSQNGEIYGNNTLIRRNSAHRLWNTGNVKIHDNYMEPYALTSISGNPGIQIEHSDVAYDMSGIEIYNNEMVNTWGEAFWIIEYGTGYQQSNKGLYVHDNSMSGAGRITTIPYNSGIAISGWNGARFEDNIIQNCYNCGFLVYAAPTSGTSTLYLKNNTITGTLETLATAEANIKTWTGYGVSCPTGLNTTIQAVGNTLTGNINGDYYGEIEYIDFIRIVSSMGMYAAEPTMLATPYTDEEDVEDGDQGLMLPTADGYAFQKFEAPVVGGKALIYPAHARGEYYLLRVAETVEDGQKVIAVPDKKGNYWPILAK